MNNKETTTAIEAKIENKSAALEIVSQPLFQ